MSGLNIKATSNRNSNSDTLNSSDNGEVTVKSFLVNLGKNFYNDYYDILTKNGVTNMKVLILASDAMLEQLTTQLLKMNFFDKLLFCSAIKELKLTSQQFNSRKRIITASMVEHGVMCNIQKHLKNLDKVDKLLAQIVLDSDANLKKQTEIIDAKFDEFIRDLKRREQQLETRRQQLKKLAFVVCKSQKDVQVERQHRVVARYRAFLNKQLSACDELLAADEYQNRGSFYTGKIREMKMKEIENTIFSQPEFEAYQNSGNIYKQLNITGNFNGVSFPDVDVFHIKDVCSFAGFEPLNNKTIDLNCVLKLTSESIRHSTIEFGVELRSNISLPQDIRSSMGLYRRRDSTNSGNWQQIEIKNFGIVSDTENCEEGDIKSNSNSNSNSNSSISSISSPRLNSTKYNLTTKCDVARAEFKVCLDIQQPTDLQIESNTLVVNTIRSDESTDTIDTYISFID